MSGERRENRLFELALYLVACARLTLDEPPIYGSLRLIEAASRLIKVAEEAWGLEVDEFLRERRESIEREKLRMIDDRDGYTAWLSEFLQVFAAEATRRNLEQPPVGPPR